MKRKAQRGLGCAVDDAHLLQALPREGAFDAREAAVGDLETDEIRLGMLPRQMQQEVSLAEANFKDERAFRAEERVQSVGQGRERLFSRCSGLIVGADAATG